MVGLFHRSIWVMVGLNLGLNADESGGWTNLNVDISPLILLNASGKDWEKRHTGMFTAIGCIVLLAYRWRICVCLAAKACPPPTTFYCFILNGDVVRINEKSRSSRDLSMVWRKIISCLFCQQEFWVSIRWCGRCSFWCTHHLRRQWQVLWPFLRFQQLLWSRLNPPGFAPWD